jgi:mRNA interferase MazF
MNCGDVVLVHFPFTDVSGSKLRPALIVSGDSFNKGDDRVLIPISSAPSAGDPFAAIIVDNDPAFGQTGLRQSSSLKWTKPLTLSKRLITRRLGTLPEPRLGEVRAQIREVFS